MNDSPKHFGPYTRKRTSFELWAELLELCTRKARTQSWLMRTMGVNTNTIKELLEHLLTRQLLKKEEQEQFTHFITTDKGEEALKQYYLLISQFFGKKAL